MIPFGCNRIRIVQARVTATGFKLHAETATGELVGRISVDQTQWLSDGWGGDEAPDPAELPKPLPVLDGLWVHRAHRRQGIAAQLVRTAVSMAYSKWGEWATTSDNRSEAADALFQKFEESGDCVCVPGEQYVNEGDDGFTHHETYTGCQRYDFLRVPR